MDKNLVEPSKVTLQDLNFLNRAIEIGEVAATHNNLPIGAVITMDGVIIAEGSNHVLHPKFYPGGHAEIEALSKLDEGLLFNNSKKMTLYTNIEPCIMCLGTIIIYRIGRVIFGANDTNRGATYLCEQLDRIYEKEQLPVIIGPVLQEKCSTMFQHADKIYRDFRDFRDSKK